jgi:hypothetical protein
MGKLKVGKPIIIQRPIYAILPPNATPEQSRRYQEALAALRKRYPKPFEPSLNQKYHPDAIENTHDTFEEYVSALTKAAIKEGKILFPYLCS